MAAIGLVRSCAAGASPALACVVFRCYAAPAQVCRAAAGTRLVARMGRLAAYVEMIAQSRLLAPNLKTMTLKLYTGNGHRGNAVAR
jgi:hypothetical protein